MQTAEIVNEVLARKEAEIERLRDALYEAFTLIEGRDGHVPDRLRLIAMGTPTVEQSADYCERCCTAHKSVDCPAAALEQGTQEKS